jgi:hypothetical protein
VDNFPEQTSFAAQVAKKIFRQNWCGEDKFIRHRCKQIIVDYRRLYVIIDYGKNNPISHIGD